MYNLHCFIVLTVFIREIEMNYFVFIKLVLFKIFIINEPNLHFNRGIFWIGIIKEKLKKILKFKRSKMITKINLCINFK